jgi:peptidoglycan/xylan/chitin deacetylase (PgdA/CDA1 family)/ketosteroid isomerase-like protein
VRDASDEALLEAWLAAGHELGSHSDRHLSLTATDAAAWLADVERGRSRLDAFLRPRGRGLRFFRFPFLREGDSEAKVDAARAWLANSGLRNLTVTIDDQDWSFEERWVKASRAGDTAAQAAVTEDYLASLRLSVRHHEETGDRLLGRPAPQILLLHANAVGAANWDALFSWLERTGHRFAGPDEVLADPAFAGLPRLAATHGFSLWDRLAMERRESEAREQVKQVLDTQSAAWTRGDVETFCSVYAADATYVSPSGLTRGRQEVLERYRKRYPGREAMGALTLDVLEMRLAWGTEVSLLGDAVPSRVHSVSVVARWTLKRPGQVDTSGLTLIVLRPRASGWEIVQDASM